MDNSVRTQVPVAQQLYRHFKGNMYQIVCVAYDSETGEEQVVYQALYGDFRYYVRPLTMFMSKVDKVKYPDAEQEYRFELVNSANNVYTEKNVTVVNSEAESEMASKTSDAEDEYDESKIDPDVVKFWDADTYEQRLEILEAMKYKITNEMIDLMATVIDIDVKEDDDVERRYGAFRDALYTRRMYETNRFR